MNTIWQQFLQQQGGVFNDAHLEYVNKPIDNPGHIITNTNIITDLSTEGLLTISGDDASKFLQGQVTADVNHLNHEKYALGGFCSIKGRLYSNFAIVNYQQQYLLRMNQPLVDQCIQQLTKYIAFFQAEMSNVSDEWVKLGLAGPTANEILLEIVSVLPENDSQLIQENNSIILKINDPLPRYELWLSLDKAQKLWQQLSQHCLPVGYSVWQLLNIRSGLGYITSETSEQFLPQMINYDLIDGISFSKGCYTGQEVVARMHYRGTSKRRMYRAHVSNTTCPTPNTKLYDSSGQQSVGNVVTAALSQPNTYELLAVIEKKAIKNDSVFLTSENKTELKILDLPYPVDALNNSNT